MSPSGSEDRIDALVRDLEPVRPIPRLRSMVAIAAGMVPLAVAVQALFGGRALRGPIAAGFRPIFVGILLGLALVAAGALAAALARAVPGREVAARRAGWVAMAGAALALVAGGIGVVIAGRGGVGLAECSGCIVHSVGLGVLPFAVVLGFVLRAFASRFGPVVLWAALGGVGLGSAAVHLSCASDQPMHWLLGHALGPVALGLLLAGPVLLVVRSRNATDPLAGLSDGGPHAGARPSRRRRSG